MSLNPNPDLRRVAREYCREANHYFNIPCKADGPVQGHYVRVNEDRAKLIAQAYETLAVESTHDSVADAYGALVDELEWQWEWIVLQGYHLEPWTEEGQPYANSEEMRADVRENNHLFYFTGGEPHPFLNDPIYCTLTETSQTGNEMLRAVHDIFGHATEGYGFGARGEENAWIHHSMMFSPLAQAALTTETRGQNSWVNFGPNAHLPVVDRPYADQKVDLLPEWACDWRAALGS
jgi:hypothetical protein